MDDLHQLAMALPGVAHELDDGRSRYDVGGKMFCCHRSPRKGAVDEHGTRFEDVLLFRVGDVGVKETMLQATDSPYFTTPHFDGYPAVLLHIPDLARVGRDELFELVADAWLTRAPKRVATSWLAEHGYEDA